VIFGRKFVSTGGISTTEEFTKLLDLNENSYVLDLGCGLGGSAFFMAENYSSKVLGIDLSSNMIARANDYKKEMEEHLRHNVTVICFILHASLHILNKCLSSGGISNRRYHGTFFS